MELQERIAEARRAAGLTQEQLGALMGVTRQAVSKWESGQAVPDALTAAALCRALGVSADYLLLGLETEQTQTPAKPQPDVCPCCGRNAPGNLCTACGYPVPTQPERGPRYALVLRKRRLVINAQEEEKLKKDFDTYCGISPEAGQTYLERLMEYGTQIAVKRDLSDTAVRWIAGHLDRDYFEMAIVEDRGEADEALVQNARAMELPPVARTDKSNALGFGGTVLAVIVGIIGAIVLLSLF